MARKAAEGFAANVLPVVRQLQAAGITTTRAPAEALNAGGIRTARGGNGIIRPCVICWRGEGDRKIRADGEGGRRWRPALLPCYNGGDGPGGTSLRSRLFWSPLTVVKPYHGAKAAASWIISPVLLCPLRRIPQLCRATCQTLSETVRDLFFQREARPISQVIEQFKKNRCLMDICVQKNLDNWR